MKDVKFLMIILLISSLFLGCQNDDDVTLNQIDFEVLTTEDGVEKVSFDSGTDVTFGLKIINNSVNEFEWQSDYSCSFFSTRRFSAS